MEKLGKITQELLNEAAKERAKNYKKDLAQYSHEQITTGLAQCMAFVDECNIFKNFEPAAVAVVLSKALKRLGYSMMETFNIPLDDEKTN